MSAFRASYRRMFTARGRRVTIERRVPNGGQPLLVEGVRARIIGAQIDEVASGVSQTRRRILILAEDVPGSFGQVREGDNVLVDGLRLRLDMVDDQTKRDGEILLAYDCWSNGA